jgi:hypothetical protein
MTQVIEGDNMLGKILSAKTATTSATSIAGLLPTVAPFLVRSLRRHPVPTVLGLAGAAIFLASKRQRQRLPSPSSLLTKFARASDKPLKPTASGR